MLILTFPEARAQNKFDRHFLISADTTITDSLTIVYESIVVVDSTGNVKISLHTDGKSIDVTGISVPLVIQYQVLPFDLSKSYNHRSLLLYDSQALFKDPLKHHFIENDPGGWLNDSDISRQGAITRGITIGSNQSLTMQSRLNLQLEGKLNDDLNVSAQITDQQMPYLPEGNSQYLREFDNVSVKLYNKKFSLEAGNQLWKHSSSFYGQYSRNVEGARVSLYRSSEKGSSTTYIGAASARGKFSRQTLPVEDGITGPYRIPRPSASSHVVILPGTETVYLDGQLLIRGYENDYVIDYNQGELTFTNTIILTRYSRVIIEFEYTQLTYQQSSIMAGHEFSSGRYSYFINYFRQHDNPRQALGMDLNLGELERISEYASESDLVLLSGADSTGFDQESLMYAKKDTITTDGKYYQVYYVSKDSERAHFKLSFRETDGGNYIIKEYSGQGKIYQWVAPVNGISQGNYEPVIGINTPETHQMISIGGAYNINDFDKVNIEYSTSSFQNNNLNPARPVNAGAASISLEGNNRPVSFLDKYTFSHSVGFQWVQQNFRSLERYRSVEFERLWLNSDSLEGDDLLFTGSFNLQKSADQQLSYQVSRRERQDNQGWLHQVDFNQRFYKFYTDADFSYVRSEFSSLTSEWTNYNINLYYQAGSWQPGVRVLAEDNSIYNEDSLTASANNFREKQLYLYQKTEGKGNLKLLYSVREDYQPFLGEYEMLSKANTFVASAAYKNLDLRANYRKVDLNQPDDEEMLSGDANWKSRFFKIIQQEIGYGLSQGRELSRAFQFVQVIPGEGTHAWRDMDGDAVKDIDEFFEAINIDERNYIKILVPTDDFVPAYESRVSYRGDIQTPETWSKSEGLVHFFSRFRGNINYHSTQKTSSGQWSDRLFGFKENIDDSLLISEKSMLQSRLVLNRTREKLGGAIGYSQTNRKQLFQVGYQAMSRQNWTADLLYGLNMFLDLNINGSLSEERLHNGFSETGNFNVRSYMLNHELVYILNQQWRITGGYRWQDREAVDFTAGKANHKEVKLNIKHSRRETYLVADVRMINIDFSGEENTASGYALLEAMRPGQNIYWQINVQQKLSGALRLSVFYDGRKSEDNDPVHLGRVQLTALF